jgi:hypothetical protein
MRCSGSRSIYNYGKAPCRQLFPYSEVQKVVASCFFENPFAVGEIDAFSDTRAMGDAASASVPPMVDYLSADAGASDCIYHC